jgi:hypothetical protein
MFKKSSMVGDGEERVFPVVHRKFECSQMLGLHSSLMSFRELCRPDSPPILDA